MVEFSRKTRLLTGVALSAGLLVSAQPAFAQCATVGTNTTCNTVVTANNSGNGPTDRNQLYNTSAGAASLTVSGAITGVGLAASPTASGANTLTVTNNGSVQVNAGNLAAAGGAAALNVNAAGATAVVYSGNGSVTNLGTAGNGLEFSMGGTGSLTANVGGNVRSAVGGNAIFLGTAGTGTGANSITTATGTTLTGDLVGAWISQTTAGNASAQTLTNNATVASLTGTGTLDFGVGIQNAGTGATTVVNNVAIGSATDRTVTEGIFNVISNAGSTAALSTSGTGAIFTAGTGIISNNSATTSALSTNTVNYTGAINSTGAFGINALGNAGALTVTTGAGAVAASGVSGVGINASTTTGAISVTNGGAVTATAVGIQTNSTTGNQLINVNGAVTSTGANDGIRATSTSGTIQVNATRAVTGSNDALELSSSGTKTVTVTGTGSLIGAIDAVNSIGTGALVLDNSGTVSGIVRQQGVAPVTVTNRAGATMTTTFLLDAGADTISNAGTLNLTGTNVFGAGADSFTNAAGGILNITSNTTLGGLETFIQSGRINLNANTLTLAGTPFVNGTGGFIDTSGNASILGITSFNNSGTLDLAPGTFTVPLVAFTNSGTILADEGASTINGQSSFANSGTIDLQDGATGDVLTINSSYVGSGGSNLLVDVGDTTADLLVVGAASGSTAVNATFVSTGLLNVPGLLVVDTAGTTANAFVLGTVGGNTSPRVDYSLRQVGNDFFLSAAPDPSAFDPVAISNMAGSLWYQTADEVTAQTDLPSVSDGFGFWGQIYYSQDKMGDDDEVAFIDGTAFAVDNELKTDRYGIQAGIDYGFGGGRIGLTGGYGVAKADNDLNSELKAKGWNIGLYGAFGGLTGFHGSALIKHDRYDLEFESGAFEGAEADLRSTGVDGSLGYRFGLGGDATLDAKVGLAHVKTKIDDITAFGFNYDIGKVTSTRGRAGVRAAFGGSLSPYVEAMVLREFKGDGDIELFDGATFYDIESDGKGTWFRLEAGLAPQLGSGPILAAWADLGDKKGFGLRAGFRFGGRAVEEVLPPPPPPMIEPAPPPPPPATQTCSDGSVILATDACPPPPPPPPPAPEPERG